MLVPNTVFLFQYIFDYMRSSSNKIKKRLPQNIYTYVLHVASMCVLYLCVWCFHILSKWDRIRWEACNWQWTWRSVTGEGVLRILSQKPGSSSSRLCINIRERNLLIRTTRNTHQTPIAVWWILLWKQHVGAVCLKAIQYIYSLSCVCTVYHLKNYHYYQWILRND